MRDCSSHPSSHPTRTYPGKGLNCATRPFRLPVCCQGALDCGGRLGGMSGRGGGAAEGLLHAAQEAWAKAAQEKLGLPPPPRQPWTHCFRMLSVERSNRQWWHAGEQHAD